MNKSELISKMETGRGQLESVVRRVDSERMPLIVLHGRWSVKDLIGHLGFWETSIAALFNTLRAGKIPEPFPHVDVVNARALVESRRQSLSEVQRQEQAAYQKLLSMVQGATEAELFAPGYFPWTEGRPFAELIADNTYGHYAEHLPELNAWLDRIS